MSRFEIIEYYGADILKSETFSYAATQTHHKRTDVASHSINTALVCIALFNILRLFHVHVNLAVLVVAALVHDFGILHRETKFSSRHECLHEHPQCSVRMLDEMYPDMDRRVLGAVESHMYPVVKIRPSSIEGWLLSLADKFAAVTDWFRHYRVGQILN